MCINEAYDSPGTQDGFSFYSFQAKNRHYKTDYLLKYVVQIFAHAVSKSRKLKPRS